MHPYGIHHFETFRDLDDFGSYAVLVVHPPGMGVPPIPSDMRQFHGPEGRRDWEHNRLPPTEPPSPLPTTHLEPSSVKFLEQLPNGSDKDAPSGVFRVRILDVGERLLKIFHGWTKDLPGRSFVREARAYERLRHSGVRAAGVVPQCYGWMRIRQEEWKFDDGRDWLAPFRKDLKPLRTLILEFFPDASKMTLRRLNPQTIEDAMKGLKIIHATGVLHNDIHPRNILVLPGGRVVWIDFEKASTWPTHGVRSINKWEIESEDILLWERFFLYMLPWKWSALKLLTSDMAQRHREELQVIEQLLVSKGATIHPV